MMYLFQFAIVVLGFLIGSWVFGLTSIFVQDKKVGTRLTAHSILVTVLLAILFLLNI
jgi:hypothetical protein